MYKMSSQDAYLSFKQAVFIDTPTFRRVLLWVETRKISYASPDPFANHQMKVDD